LGRPKPAHISTGVIANIDVKVNPDGSAARAAARRALPDGLPLGGYPPDKSGIATSKTLSRKKYGADGMAG